MSSDDEGELDHILGGAESDELEDMNSSPQRPDGSQELLGVVRTRHGHAVGNAVGSNLHRVISAQVRRSMVELRLLSTPLYKCSSYSNYVRYLAFLFRRTAV